MFCRIESLEENEFNVYCNVKENIKKLLLTLSKIQHQYNMKIINNLIKDYVKTVMLLFSLCYQIFLTRVGTGDVNWLFIELNKHMKKKHYYIMHAWHINSTVQ